MASLTNTRHYRLAVAGFNIPVGATINTTNGRLTGDDFATLHAMHLAGEIVMSCDPEDPGKTTIEPAMFVPELTEEQVAADAKAAADAAAKAAVAAKAAASVAAKAAAAAPVI